MDGNYLLELKKCVEIMAGHIDSGDSFVLAKTKAMRYLFLTQDDAKMLQSLSEYQTLKTKYLNQHRADKKWTNK